MKCMSSLLRSIVHGCTCDVNDHEKRSAHTCTQRQIEQKFKFRIIIINALFPLDESHLMTSLQIYVKTRKSDVDLRLIWVVFNSFRFFLFFFPFHFIFFVQKTFLNYLFIRPSLVGTYYVIAHVRVLYSVDCVTFAPTRDDICLSALELLSSSNLLKMLRITKFRPSSINSGIAWVIQELRPLIYILYLLNSLSAL